MNRPTSQYATLADAVDALGREGQGAREHPPRASRTLNLTLALERRGERRVGLRGLEVMVDGAVRLIDDTRWNRWSRLEVHLVGGDIVDASECTLLSCWPRRDV